MPWTSSGDVSIRTRMTGLPASLASTARSGSKIAWPTAAPGEAFRPLPRQPIPHLRLGGLVEARQEELDDLRRVDALERLLAGDELLVRHVDGDLHGGRRRPLAGARLEHVERAALDRELEVLHVAVVALEALGDLLELRVHLGHLVAHLADLRRGPDAGDDVLALRVGQVLAVDRSLAGVRVTGERDAGARVVAHVAEHHGHDVHRGAEVVRDLVVLAVVVGALAEPRVEDGAHGQLELPIRIGRERLPRLLLDDLRERLGRRRAAGRRSGRCRASPWPSS